MLMWVTLIKTQWDTNPKTKQNTRKKERELSVEGGRKGLWEGKGIREDKMGAEI